MKMRFIDFVISFLVLLMLTVWLTGCQTVVGGAKGLCKDIGWTVDKIDKSLKDPDGQ